jgi:hypothetical protein
MDRGLRVVQARDGNSNPEREENEMMTAKKTLIASAILLTGFATAFAGGKDARVRVVHASPDAPSVDVLVDDSLRAFEGTAFEQYTDYAALPAGTYNVKVVPSGAGPGSAVIEADLSLFYNRDYTVVAVNLLDRIEALVLEDTNRPLSPKDSRVRFLHASPDAPPVDVAVSDGGPILFGDISFRELGDYIKVPAGLYDLEVRVAGTSTVALPLPGIELEGGKTYTVYATGEATTIPATLNAVISEDAGSPAMRSHGWGRCGGR